MTPGQLLEWADRRFSGIVHYVDGSTVLASRGATVLRSDDEGRTWRPIWTVPVSAGRRLASAHRLTRRLTRLHIHHIQPLGTDRLCIVGFGTVFTLVPSTGEVIDTLQLDFSRPLALCTLGDRAYFGEYQSNPNREPVRIWASGPGGISWEPVWTFEKVRHVHGVFRDPYQDALWITTGDRDSESAIWRTTDEFGSVQPVIHGGQHARVVQPLFTPTHVYFGTDAPSEANHLYRMDRMTGSTEQMQTVDGPVFWGLQIGQDYFFSTVCEPSAVNETMHASVWHGNDNTWAQVLNLPKDRWPMKLLQYGQILFPAGPGVPQSVWLTPFATHLDQQSFRIPIGHLTA